jgi:hypothetical protein
VCEENGGGLPILPCSNCSHPSGCIMREFILVYIPDFNLSVFLVRSMEMSLEIDEGFYILFLAFDNLLTIIDEFLIFKK